MNYARIVGNNIALELQKHSMTLKTFATAIGYSERDAHKLLEGRLFTPPFQLEKMAQVLQIKKEQLMEQRKPEEYNALIHNFREFKNPENQELVLNLIDMYADLEEALAE